MRKWQAVPLVAVMAISVWASASSAARKKTTTFEGSCALKGTVLFDPGATMVPQPLRYEFNGEGMCTGTLDGTEINDVPVSAHQHGRSEGSCAEAHTTEPGIGQVTFPGGEVLHY